MGADETTMRFRRLRNMGFNRITSLYRFLFLLIFSAALMIVDHRSELLSPVRTVGTAINLPFQLLFNLPAKMRGLIEAYYPDDQLHREYQELAAKQRELEARLQRYDAVEAENRRLAKLLSMSREFDNRVLHAEIVDIGLAPFTHRVALNRGAEAGVHLGQPVITPDGVLGQVSGVGLYRSVVTLITDPGHAIPVQVQRNGLRTIAQGLGVANQLEVPFLSGQADIQNADVLVTSGLGGGFPAGYKVAQVREIVTDANETFLMVSATTFTNIDLVKEVLLLGNNEAAADQVAPPARQ